MANPSCKKTDILRIRITPETKQQLKEFAEADASCKNTASWIRNALLYYARRQNGERSEVGLQELNIPDFP